LQCFFVGAENEKASIVNQQKLEKKFGQSSVFVASTLLENGGTLKSASPASLLKEAIHVISCGYEDKTDWGKDVSVQHVSCILCWLYGRNKYHVLNHTFRYRLVGFMDQLQKIFLLGLRCTAMVGDLFTACPRDQHSRDPLLSISLIVSIKF